MVTLEDVTSLIKVDVRDPYEGYAAAVNELSQVA
jgi:hypothetical protein